jgi:hypothetical protein
MDESKHERARKGRENGERDGERCLVDGFDNEKDSFWLVRVAHVAPSLTITANNMVRKLKYHEQKLLKKVDFLNVCVHFM